MADAIRIRSGNKDGMPHLADREPAYVRDENAFYIGTPAGNKKVGAEELEKKLTARPAASQAALAAEATLAQVIEAHNALIAALKASGIMSN